MQSTSIEWATVSWNPIRGCSRVSLGCGGPNGAGGCYAEKIAARFSGPGQPYEGLTTRGRWNGKMRLVEEKLEEPLHWRKPQRIFANSMSDLFHENLTNHEIARVFATMARAYWHTFLVLTKRHARMERFFREQEPPIGFQWPLPNVFLGVSVENQATADERIPILLQIPAAVLFVSYEPALGGVSFFKFFAECACGHGHGFSACPNTGAIAQSCHRCDCTRLRPLISQVIPGGESGPKARPCNVAWIRSVIEQCKAAGTACFVKQLGANVRDRNDAGFDGDEDDNWPEGTDARPLEERNWQGDPVRVHLRDRKGGDMDEWPNDLRVRQFPEARV
jgi:protein gp37